MRTISNAIILDDKINLLLNGEDGIIDEVEYRNLKTIHDFFLNHTIPFTVIDGVTGSLSDLIVKLKNVTKPDLVVLDLDLNSNGTIDEFDRSLIKLILTTLRDKFNDFIIFVYSSQEEEWDEIRSELLSEDESLATLLNEENVYVARKSEQLTLQFDQSLTTAISNRTSKYYARQLQFVNKIFNKYWNKEILVILFFCISIILIVQFSFSDRDNLIFILVVAAMLITALIYIAESRSKQK